MKRSREEAAADLKWGQRLAEEVMRELANDPELRAAFDAISMEEWLRSEKAAETSPTPAKSTGNARTKRNRRAPKSRS